MKYVLKAEEAVSLILSLAILAHYPADWSWYVYVALFFAPDLGMLGYMAGNRTGAITYNLLHHKAVALALAGIGWQLGSLELTSLGLLFFAHSCFDRLLGYGLKHATSFQHTHLGLIGKNSGVN